MADGSQTDDGSRQNGSLGALSENADKKALNTQRELEPAASDKVAIDFSPWSRRVERPIGTDLHVLGPAIANAPRSRQSLSMIIWGKSAEMLTIRIYDSGRARLDCATLIVRNEGSNTSWQASSRHQL